MSSTREELLKNLSDTQKKFIERVFFASADLNGLIEQAQKAHDEIFFTRLNLILEKILDTTIWERIIVIENILNDLDAVEPDKEQTKNARQHLHNVLYIVLNHQAIYKNRVADYQKMLAQPDRYIGLGLIDNSFIFEIILTGENTVLGCFHTLRDSYAIATHLCVLDEYFTEMAKLVGCIDAGSMQLMFWAERKIKNAPPLLDTLIQKLIAQVKKEEGLEEEYDQIFLAIEDRIKNNRPQFEVKEIRGVKAQYFSGNFLTKELLAHYLVNTLEYEGEKLQENADKYVPAKPKQTVSNFANYEVTEATADPFVVPKTQIIAIDEQNDAPGKQKMHGDQKSKTFWQAHWKKILIGALIVSLLVVAGVFTAGVVPLIAAGLGVSFAAAAGIGFGGAALVGGLVGAGVGAIAGAIPSKRESGVKAFLSRHKWKILASVLVVGLIVGSILTGGILAAFGVVAAAGAVGTGLAVCGGIVGGISGGVAATTAAAGLTISATAATVISVTTVATGTMVVGGGTTGLIIGAIADNREMKEIKNEQKIIPIVLDPQRESMSFFGRLKKRILGPKVPTADFQPRRSSS